MTSKIELRDAFPSFATSNDAATVRRILGDCTRVRSATVARDERQHLVPLMLCAHVVPSVLATVAAAASPRAPSPAELTSSSEGATFPGMAGVVPGQRPRRRRWRLRRGDPGSSDISYADDPTMPASLEGADGDVWLDGQTVCGRQLHPCHPAVGGHHYRGGKCVGMDHHTAVPPSIEPIILAAVARHFTPSLLAPVAEAGWVRRTQERTQIPVLQRQVAVLETQLRGAETMEARAYGDNDADKVGRAQRLQDDTRTELRAVTARLRELEAQRGALSTMVTAERDAIFALATDLPALFARAADHPEAVREVLSILLHAVHVRREATGVLVVGLQYVTGHVEWLRVATRRVRAYQPERVWALGRLAEGADAADVACALNAWIGARPSIPPWTPERLAALSAQWAGRDPTLGEFTPDSTRCITVDDLPHTRWRRTVAEIADDVGAPVGEVWRHTLLGTLGPAVYQRGTLLVRPSKRRLHAAFPEYARRVVAERAGWALREVVRLDDAARAARVPIEDVEARAHAGHGTRRDKAQRTYVRRSDVLQQ